MFYWYLLITAVWFPPGGSGR